MTTIFQAASQLKQRGASVEDQLDVIEPPPEQPPTDRPADGGSNAVTVQNVGRTERRPTKGEGERAFGSPTSPPPLRNETDRESIRQQQRELVERMNKLAHQSTDKANK